MHTVDNETTTEIVHQVKNVRTALLENVVFFLKKELKYPW